MLLLQAITIQDRQIKNKEYAKLKAQREVVSDLQKIHRYVDIALKEDAPQQSKTRNHNIDR